ncbi:MAG: S-methyl-5-thioribose-1-phosphate isomerase [Candidatus Omnitrophica bacterium]|nr:S-methyl-5-thioribose-1-phosphate isomerase [Candidatus Omnitrophota bacterium]
MKIVPIRFANSELVLLDQRFLPARERYVRCRSAEDTARAIKSLVVRGAPAIGIAAAYGAYLGIAGAERVSGASVCAELRRVNALLSAARPTAVNLFWALERIEKAAAYTAIKGPAEQKKAVLLEARKIHADDKRACSAISRYGARLFPKGSRVITHCNAGMLATGGTGTALGVIYAAGKKIEMVYADETRPVLQGSRLTAWELARNRIPVTLICDNMAGAVMSRGKADAVIVGADRIASNGDTANKIGTYGLAVLARHHGLPFYVAAPASTFDLSLKRGEQIIIEERPSDEIKNISGKIIAPPGVHVWNPAFDITPAKLITAIITDRGVIKAPDRDRIAEILSRKPSCGKSGKKGE